MENSSNEQLKINFLKTLEIEIPQNTERKLKSMLIKVDIETHKRLMQMRVNTGKMMNDFINEAIIFKLNQENF